ncbi:MAG: hypothetical protein R3F34_10155 [Planctomycetota bacterium]
MTTSTRARAEREAVSGRCRIEGLLEGPLPPVPGFREYLENWTRELERRGIAVVANVDGGRFDVFAPELDVAIPRVGLSPTDSLADAVRELLDKVPDGERSRVHSTLRTVESGDGVETRTLLAVRSPGVLERVEDRVAVATAPPIPARRALPSWAPWVVVVVLAAVLAAGGLLGWFDRLGLPAPIDPTKLHVSSASPTVELLGIGPEGPATGAWTVEFRRGVAPARRPSDDAPAEAWLDFVGSARGRGVLEWRDADGRLLRVDPVDLEPVAPGDTGAVRIGPPPPRSATVRFGW